jgi:hypothetical protein
MTFQLNFFGGPYSLSPEHGNGWQSALNGVLQKKAAHGEGK